MPGTLPSFSAAPALPVRGPVLPTVLPPARPGGPRRVQARLLALPAASPPAPPSRWPDVAHAAAPVAVPRPAPLAALTTAVAAPARQQDTAAWQPAAEASAAGPRADTAPHGDTVLHADPDPYGDYAEALAAGLSSTPPLGLLPPDPGTDRSDRAAQRRRDDRGRAGQPAAARLVPGDPGPEHPPGRPDGRSASGLRAPPDAGSVTGRPCHGAVDPAGTHCT